MTLRDLLSGASLLALTLPATAQQQMYPNVINQPVIPSLLTNCTTTPTGNCPLSALGGFSAGAIIYGGVSSWLTLPAGSAGQVLTSGGAGAPSWKPSPALAGVCANLEQFGGVGDGVTDNAAPMNNLLAAFSSNVNGGCLQEGAGKFEFTSRISYTYPSKPTWSISVSGAGADTTIFDWVAGGGILIHLLNTDHTFHFSNLTFMTGAANVGTGLGIIFTSPSSAANSFSDVQGVTFRGESTTADYWGTGFSSTGVSFINFDGDDFTGSGGNGISVAGSTGAPFPFAIAFNLDKVNFNGLVNSFIYGNGVQGVTIDNTNFANGSIGILVPSGETGLDELSVTNSQLNETGENIEILSTVPFQFSNDLFIVTLGGLLCQPCSIGNIANSQFIALTPGVGVGVDVVTDSQPGIVFTGNAFTGMSTAVLCSTGTFCNLQSNIYSGNTNKSNPAATTGNITIGGGSQ